MVKWGYVEKLLEHCVDTNGAWDPNFAKCNKHFNQAASQKSRTSSNAYRIGYAISRVYSSLSFEVVMRLFTDSHFKLVGKDAVLQLVCSLNKAR